MVDGSGYRRDDFEGQNFSASYYTCNLRDGKNLSDAYLASNAELKLAHQKVLNLALFY